MKKILTTVFLLTGGIATAYAQDIVTLDNSLPTEKRFEHQVGVQMNELIRQVFNFNNNTAVNNNPYLLIYSISHKRTGVGLRLGAGYTNRSFVDDDGVNSRNTKINDLQLRAGIEKSFNLSKRWTAGAGLDFVYADNSSETKSILRAFDTTTTIINSTVGNIGGGAMAWLRYAVSDHILIGTETSFYYRFGTKEQTIDITRRDLSIPTRPMVTTSTKIDSDETDGRFALPVVFYLIVRF